MSSVTMRFTFPDGEEQEHSVPYPLLQIVELVQRGKSELTFEQGVIPREQMTNFRLHTVKFRLVHFADSTGRNWSEYHVDK